MSRPDVHLQGFAMRRMCMVYIDLRGGIGSICGISLSRSAWSRMALWLRGRMMKPPGGTGVRDRAENNLFDFYEKLNKLFWQNRSLTNAWRRFLKITAYIFGIRILLRNFAAECNRLWRRHIIYVCPVAMKCIAGTRKITIIVSIRWLWQLMRQIQSCWQIPLCQLISMSA